MRDRGSPRWFITIARLGIIALFLMITMLQVFSFPGQFAHMRTLHRIDLLFEVILTLLVGLWLTCGQLALFFLWKLIDLMSNDAFYTHESLRWIDRLLIAFKGAVIVPGFLFALIAPQADDPGFLVMVVAVALFLFMLYITTALIRDQIGKRIVN